MFVLLSAPEHSDPSHSNSTFSSAAEQSASVDRELLVRERDRPGDAAESELHVSVAPSHPALLTFLTGW